MTKLVTTPPRGSRDFLPRDVRQREYVTRIIRDVFQSYGFAPLETPAFERLDTLLGKYGEEGDQLLFKILLRGEPLVQGIRSASELLQREGAVIVGRSGETAPGAEPLLADMGLRYDLTVPFARVYANNQGKLPAVFKRFQIQPVWRADTPGRGRFREFYQCDVDVVGSSSNAVEAEVAGAAAQCLKRLGFSDFKLRLNHRGLLRAIVEHCGIEAAHETSAIVAIDKLDKIGAEGVTKELAARGISSDAAQRLVELMTHAASLPDLREQLASNERAVQAIDELLRVLDLASVTPAHGHLEFDVSLARGLGYYTGAIFEIAVKDLAGSLGGGGRYDGLIGMFSGKQVPACGFSLGLERILVVMEERKLYPADIDPIHALLAPVDEADMKNALALAVQLRAAGLRVDLLPKAAVPGKLRKQADDQGIGAAAWIEAGQTGRASVWIKRDGSTHKDLDADALVAALKVQD
ncbi:MAG TPA: histidine--tRNA ligase [Polyangiales bacterium]|nr:histidine--tRNA ligase [Polyangiales bacterium]